MEKREMPKKMEQKEEPPKVNVEIKKIENLKEDIRDKYSLGESGHAFKIITQNSPIKTRYEKIEGGFFESVSNLLKSSDLGGVAKRLRKR